MNDLIANLEALNRKERYFVFTRATGNHDFKLGADFVAKLSKAIDVPVPDDAKAYIDYHLDWLHAAVYIAGQTDASERCMNGDPMPKGVLRPPGSPPRVSTGTQEDLDLLVVFELEGTT